VGADLTLYRDHFSSGKIYFIEDLFFADYGQNIHSAGKTGYVQIKPEKLFAVVFVRKLRQCV
jgi:hypothetical protein